MTDSDPRNVLQTSLDKPSVGRIYDYMLGGHHNYAIDRQFAEQQIAITPQIREAAQTNRAFLTRAVTYATQHGIRQFIDIGSGLPTQGNVHDIAETHAPGQTHVIYIDNDPIAQAHSHILLADTADPHRHHALYGDFNNPHQLWHDITNTSLIDTTQPTCLLLVALLHFISDEQHPHQTLNYYRNKLPPGSLLVISHGAIDPNNKELREHAKKLTNNYRTQSTAQAHLRTREQIQPFFGDWELIEPGLVWPNQWRPDTPTTTDPTRSNGYGGIARKP